MTCSMFSIEGCAQQEVVCCRCENSQNPLKCRLTHSIVRQRLLKAYCAYQTLLDISVDYVFRVEGSSKIVSLRVKSSESAA